MTIETLTLILLCLSILTQETLSLNDNIYGWAQRSGEYSEWIKQVDKSDANYKLFLQNSVLKVTAFIPTNEAFDEFDEPSNDIIGSHLVSDLLDSDSLLKIKNKSPLGVKRSMLRFSSGLNEMSNRSTIFVLDARILESHKVGNSMVHIIDRVLNLPKSTESVAPTALEWIKNRNIYPSVSVRGGVDSFADFIERENVNFQFSNCAECTFFVPENIDNKTTAKIDENVLLGHIIPNQILFLRSMNNSTPYKTKANSSKLIVELYKEERSDSGSMKSFIYSNTKGSISNHLGNTKVKITRASIPVNNGVIHVIEKPLIITDVSISDHLNEEIEANEIHASVNIPIGGGKGLIKSHFNEQKTISSQNDGMVKETATLVPNFSDDEGNPQVVTDSDVRPTFPPNLACVNNAYGELKVLSVPNATIKDLLRNHSDFKTTFTVGEKLNWTSQLDRKDWCFTFFAPTEAAWNKIRLKDSALYEKLIEGSAIEDGKALLDQLLVKASWPFDYLAAVSGVSTVRSFFLIEHGPQLTLKWMDSSSIIVRPDIRAINGYIHGVDTIFIELLDFRTLYAAAEGSSSISQLSPVIIIFSIAAYIVQLF